MNLELEQKTNWMKLNHVKVLERAIDVTCSQFWYKSDLSSSCQATIVMSHAQSCLVLFMVDFRNQQQHLSYKLFFQLCHVEAQIWKTQHGHAHSCCTTAQMATFMVPSARLIVQTVTHCLVQTPSLVNRTTVKIHHSWPGDSTEQSQSA